VVHALQNGRVPIYHHVIIEYLAQNCLLNKPLVTCFAMHRWSNNNRRLVLIKS
jgi:hypothetical protein